MNLTDLKSRLLLACLVSILQGCQLFGIDKEATQAQKFHESSLASLQPALLTLPPKQSPTLGIDEVIDSYTRLLPLLQEPEKQLTVLHRLADLKLQKGEQLMAEQAVDELDIAVSAYLGLLEKYPERRDNDEVLYQLAKTYDLKGEAEAYFETLTRLVNDYPDSVYRSEVQFRRGEILFAWSDYVEAEAAFANVVQMADASYLNNAMYMLGWSVFKQNRYEQSLVYFSRVLDDIFSDQAEFEIVDTTRTPVHQNTLVADLLRVMNLSFSYLEGAESIVALFQQVGLRHYEVMVYASYSEWLLKNERYLNAIEVYQAFIRVHPMSLWAPRFHIQGIETLNAAKFSANIYDEKARFIEQYGKGSAFWDFHESNPQLAFISREDDHLAFTREQLERLILELADLHYVKAQLAEKKQKKNEKNLSADARENYQKSALYNRRFAETFPAHPELAKRQFLLGESEFKLANWLAAIDAYQQAAYNFPGFEDAAEAGYASIVAFDAFSQTWQGYAPHELQNWQAQRQANRIRFVDEHPVDHRALSVLFVVLSETFQQKKFEETLNYAQRLLAWQTSFTNAPKPGDTERRETQIIKAHSLYALARYADAESAYYVAIADLAPNDARQAALTENLAASVYRQAEGFLSENKKSEAINELLRVGKVAPFSSLRQNAEYDAANYLIELKRWPDVIDVLSAFRQAYPQHHLIDTLPAKLALAYRETEQWANAAGELKRMRELAKTEQEKQDISFIIAELYDKAAQVDDAIVSYRAYANQYAEPADVYMEAANRLAELYAQTNDPLKQRFWLAKQIQRVDELGNRADDRMRYLAASASSILANDAFIQYKSIRLTLPLEASLEKKTKALETAMKAYQRTASYGISVFSTEAGYRMAELYSILSQALMESDRPDDLNELELEQYEILLEEQVFPFEDNAIDIHEQNASRAWAGVYDDWIKKSFKELRRLLPGRYAKDEVSLGGVDALE